MTAPPRLHASAREVPLGESLRATYRVGPDAVIGWSARGCSTAVKAATQFQRARDVADAQGADARSVLFDEELSTVFWVFPQDRKLVGLGRLTAPPPELRDVFGAPWTHSELMAYTPEKAATVRCMDSRGATVGFAKLQGADGPPQRRPCGQRGAASPSTASSGCPRRSGTCPSSTWPCSRRPPVGRCTNSTAARFREP